MRYADERQARMSNEFRSPPVVLGLLRLGDVVVVALAALFAYWVRHGHVEVPFSYLVVTLIGVVLVANTLHAARLYNFRLLLALPAQIHKLSVSLPLVFLMLLGLGFFTKTSSEFSRVWMVLWFSFSLVGLAALRVFLTMRLRVWQRQGWLTRNLVVIGQGDISQRILHHLASNADPSINILGTFDDRQTRVPQEIAGFPQLGTIADVAGYVRDHRVDDILIALPSTAQARLIACIDQLKTVPIRVHLCLDTIGLRLPDRGIGRISGVPLFHILEPPLAGWSQVVKTVEDRVLSALILLLILPMLATIALLIRLDSPGPVLFRQRRFGFNNNVFEVYKFRSMTVDDAYADGAHQAERDDPRVTRLGAFLRRHSLDELPQFFNVLRGDMSIVGPRPHAVPHNEQYSALIDDYLARHRVKPGITGWAQVNGLRGETKTIDKMEARVRYDLYYVDNWTLMFDLRIILLTLFVGFRPQNVY